MISPFDATEEKMPKGKHVLAMPKEKHIFGTVKVGEKGQIVIPKEAREHFGIAPGETLLVLGDDTRGLIVTKPEAIRELAMRIFGESNKTKE